MNFQLLSLSIVFFFYPILGKIILLNHNKSLRIALFLLLNILGVLGLSLVSNIDKINYGNFSVYIELSILFFIFYLILLITEFYLIKKYVHEKGHERFFPFIFPIIILIVLKYTPVGSFSFENILGDKTPHNVSTFFLGLSYMAFRTSYLTIEIRTNAVPIPKLFEFLSFSLFLPTFLMGPISQYKDYYKGMNDNNLMNKINNNSFMRMLIGAVKLLFLGNILNQLSYSGLMLDGYSHDKSDLIISVISFYLFLYCNFSGYCDLSIGCAGLLGIKINENFDNPLLSRNIKEFWNKWHITLSKYTRDVIFTPLSKLLILKYGIDYNNLVIVFSTFIVFIVIGVWHGSGLNYLIFGLIHGLGVIINFYYSTWLKNNLSKNMYKKYLDSTVIKIIATALTFIYVSISLFFFANDISTMKIILASIK